MRGESWTKWLSKARGRSLLVGLLASLVLLTGCVQGGRARFSGPGGHRGGRQRPHRGALVVHTVVVTATPLPATSTPAYAPEAKLIRNSPAGKCRWTVYMALTGFAPNSSITVNSRL